MRRLSPERFAHLALGLVAMAVMAQSMGYGLGTARKPGPGLFPFCVGLLLASTAFALFFRAKTKTNAAPLLGSGSLQPFTGVILALVFWATAMPLLGYPIVTGATTLAVSKIMKLEGWLQPLMLSLGTALFIYLLFDYWLYIDLPRGILG